MYVATEALLSRMRTSTSKLSFKLGTPKKNPRQFPAGGSFRELSDDRDQTVTLSAKQNLLGVLVAKQ